MLSTRHYQVRSELDFEPFAEVVANSVRGPFGSTGQTKLREVQGKTQSYADQDCIVDFVVGFILEGQLTRVQETDEVRIAAKSPQRVYELAIKPEVLRELFARNVIDRAIEYIKPEYLPRGEVPISGSKADLRL